MEITTTVSESLVENLLIEIEMITSRINKIFLNYNQTNNKILRIRLFNEHQDLSSRLIQINKISKIISKYNKQDISLANLLLIHSSKSLNKTYKNKNLFFI